MESFQTLEVEFSKFAGYSADTTVACSSGTAALHLTMESLSLPLGSEVILCDFNMLACARAVTLAGLKPIFVDCDDILLINEHTIVSYLEYHDAQGILANEVSAILATHVYGRSCDMQAIHDIAAKYDLKVIEDLAEAHGVPPHPNTDAACYSFYKNKIIGGEEGGAICFKDKENADKARRLRSLGFGPNQDYQHEPRGHNYRLANCLADKVLEKLRDYNHYVAYRRMVEEWYDKHCPSEWKQPERQAPWVYDIRIPGMRSEEQDDIVEMLKLAGIEGRHGFKPMSVQEEYRVKGLGISKAMVASREVIYLPLWSPNGIDEEDCKKAFDIIRGI